MLYGASVCLVILCSGARFLEAATLSKSFHAKFKRKLRSNPCYQMILVRTGFCVWISLIFRFTHLACFSFFAMLLSVSHLSLLNIFCCLYYMPGVCLKSPMLCLRSIYCVLFSQNSLDNSVSDLRFLWLSNLLWFAYRRLNFVSHIL